jgi:tungstate transport system ATP-binding protein
MSIDMNSANSQPIYTLEGLTKVYNGRTVLAVDRLSIYPGEVFALVGPSGSGKSTLLRLLNFLEDPTSGLLEFEGTPVRSTTDLPIDLKRRVTTVFQRPMLLSGSVWDNVEYGLRLRGVRNSRGRIENALEQVGLAHLAKQPARTLSGGEAQRVALARAIVLQPDVLLLDEPTANLDPFNVGIIESIVRQINAKHRTTLALVTHNVFQARRLATRVAFLLEGKVIEIAETEQFFSDSADPRTRAFVHGDMVY